MSIPTYFWWGPSVNVRADCNPHYSYSIENISEDQYIDIWKDIFCKL